MIGQGSNLQRLERWLKAVVFGPGAPPGGLVITVRHASVDEAARLLRTWPLDTIPDREAFHDLVAEIDVEATEDAEQLGFGVQRYLVRAATAQGKELGSLSIRCSTNSLTTDGGAFADSEPPSARGQVALSMRHTDAAFRLLGTGYVSILDSLNRRLGQQDQLVERMMEHQSKVFEMMGDLSERRLERDLLADANKKQAELEFMKEVQQLDRNQMLLKMGMEKVAPLLPILVNRFAGTSATPAAPTPRDELLVGLFESLTPEQALAFRNLLTPGQLANLQELFQAVHAARGSTGEAASSPAGAQPNGDKFSDQTAYIALEEIKRNLLPWGAARLKAGQALDPTAELPKQARLFQSFIRALTPGQYKDVVTNDGFLTAEERRVFSRMAEALGLVPGSDATSGSAG